jgi:ribosomal protein S27E
MATNDVVINDLITFEVGDPELEALLSFLGEHGTLRMDCRNCGTTIIPQARAQHSQTGLEEFKVDCIGCGNSITVRMYGKYGFILPTDDEFYKGIKSSDGWEKRLS